MADGRGLWNEENGRMRREGRGGMGRGVKGRIGRRERGRDVEGKEELGLGVRERTRVEGEEEDAV